MNIKRLILLLLAIVWFIPAGKAQPTAGNGAELTVTNDRSRPQWEDLGMCDVLAVSSSTSLTPPPTVRHIDDTLSACSTSATLRRTAPHVATDVHAATKPRVCRGYLYLLQCLRL